MSALLGKQLKIHDSHKMGAWEDTVVTLICTPRFGRIRRCEYCDGEEAETVAGRGVHSELIQACLCVPNASGQRKISP